MKAISYGTKVCRNLESALTKEWWEENQKGAHAASSILGANTKPEHGLLVVSGNQPSKKSLVLLSTLEETLFIGDQSYPLSTCLYANQTVFPKGYEYLEHFYKLPFPTWIFRAEGLALVKIVILMQDQPTVVIRYQLLSSYGDFVRFQIRPVVAFRPASQIVKGDAKRIPRLEAKPGEIHLEYSNSFPTLHFFHNAAVVDRSGKWLKHVRYTKNIASESGQEEDLYSPCSLLYGFLKEDGVYLTASTSPEHGFDPFLVGVGEKNKRFSKKS